MCAQKSEELKNAGSNKLGITAYGCSDTQAAKEEHQRKLKTKTEQEAATLWQHPFVDVFKHFKLMPGNDWKLNKKQGGVEEYFAKEIGRRAVSVEGTISANNYIQVPNPQGPIKILALTGRYIYFQVKVPRQGLPFSYHIDLGMAERSHGVRISVSNLFKTFATSNGFVAQVPLELKNNCWTVVVIDIFDILKKSDILPSTYLIEGSYQIRSITICANTHVRGVFTSDNLYDFVTLPPDMRFKFAFDLSRWTEYFGWQTIPQDWDNKNRSNTQGILSGFSSEILSNRQQKNTNASGLSRDNTRTKLGAEIDEIISSGTNKQIQQNSEIMLQDDLQDQRQKRYDDIQHQLQMQFNKQPSDHPVTGFIIQNEDDSEQILQGVSGGRSRPKTAGTSRSDYKSGMYNGVELARSPKLNKDPILELKHIIGYQADKCMDIRWAKAAGDNVVVFTSGGTLVAQDIETNEQKRFFFGHSAPVCCFDINYQGNMMASAQEGKNSIIRIWDYASARCISMMTMPVISLKRLSFSADGRYLASVGKDKNNKELIMIWDISGVQRGDKPNFVAKQTSEFNVLDLKFSPIDPTRLASCGKENIRLWRIREQGNIRGSAVVLNQHARNTIFTCLDFEYGFRSADFNENASLKRIFIGSKHGMVFQVNYQTEALEATYKTNDAAIFSIAVNEAFCVIGSEDTYLRIWPLDFQEFFMEAQHEGTVSAVDISPDGLKVACGTLYGSIGILDKSNQNYKTLMRSHTDEVLAMDFVRPKQNIVTVSRDRTIRLWDISTLEEVYEFSSPVDQPLCVSAHPTLPIFACGFESGKMRIFDIDSTEVTDEFSQFNKPLKSLSYDNTGKLLVACSQDGSVSIHNALRQHLPIKMMHLELVPEYVHVSFTERILSGQQNDASQKFGVVGEHGNNVIIYDTESFLVQHQVNVQNIIRSFRFANSNRDLLVVTKDCKIRFYSLLRYEGIFLREVQNCHRGSITALDISQNSGYFMTGGEDNIINVWDYEAQKTTPYFFQSFIGHIYPISGIMFNPIDNSQIFTVSERDGIYAWQFSGDIDSDYKQANLAGQDLPQLELSAESKNGSLLEKMRIHNKAKKNFRNQMSEDSFIIPQFSQMEQITTQPSFNTFNESPNYVQQKRDDRKLTYNHYVNCSKKINSELENARGLAHLNIGQNQTQLITQKIISGYDGFGGVHDNLIWSSANGLTFFTLNNKFIIENTKTREQEIFSDSTVQLSCLTASVDGKYVAVAEGTQNLQGNSLILLYDIKKKKLVNRLTFHEKGVQSIAFTYDNKYLISIGVQGENTLALWDIQSGLVIKSAILSNYATNQIKVDPFVDSAHIQFVTVGNNASLTFWRLDTLSQQLTFYKVTEPDHLKHLNFLSAEFSHYLPAPAGTYYVVIGTNDGSIISFDQENQSFVELTQRSQVVEGQIGAISIKNNSIVLASSRGQIIHYPILGSSIQPEDFDLIEMQAVDSAIIAISMDSGNNEGLIGTESGCIYFINFNEKVNIRLVSSNNKNQDQIRCIQFDPQMSKIFLAGCGKKSEELKVFTSKSCDEVMAFKSNFEEEGYIVFVISSSGMFIKNKKQRRLIGFSNGIIKRISLESLQIEQTFRVPLQAGEKLTCGQFSENDVNFAFGTNYGTLFFGSQKLIGRAQVATSYCRIDNICRMNSFEGENQKYKMNQRINSDMIRENESIGLERVDSQTELQDQIGISSISFPYLEHVQKILIAFDDGSIKLWQSAVNNEQFMKMLELQQASKKKYPTQRPFYDLMDVGYQQFDLLDSFDIFQNPHGLEEISETDRIQLKALYSGKKYPSCQARFTPGPSTSMSDQYFCLVDALQYIFIRNYIKSEIIKRISLSMFPTCISIVDFKDLKIDEESSIRDVGISRGNFLVAIGTKEGRIVVYRIGTLTHNKLLYTNCGIAYGEISNIDVQGNGEMMLASSQTGEILQYELLKLLNELRE